MQKISFIILYCFLHFSVFSQKNEIFTIIQTNDIVKIDKTGNLYLVNGTQLTKYNSKGEREYSFSKPNFGNIFQIDVSNPLNILVFYRTSQTIVRLDNTNSSIGNPINLQTYNIGEALVIANGQENGYWVFDGINYELSFIDFNGQALHKSTSISRLNNQKIENPKMGIFNNRIHLFTNNNLYIFDNRANLIETVSLESEQLIINESGIYKIEDESLKILTKGSQKFETLITDYKGFEKHDCYLPYLLLSQKDKITLYLLTSEKTITHE